MFNGFDGQFSVDRLDPAQIEEHRATLVALPDWLSKLGVVVTNGSIGHTHPTHGQAGRYFEGTANFSGRDFDAVVPQWKGNAGNVLSVFADNADAVERALNEWLRWGGWLAFTTQAGEPEGSQAVRAAYTKARELRQSLVLAPTEPDPGPGGGPGSGEPGGGGPGNSPTL